MKKFFYDKAMSAAERVLPPLSKSAFKEKGVLTPEEFVAAGDYLVQTCPTWAWESGDAEKARSYLPKNKQFLITRNVPCLRRAAAVEEYGQAEEQEVEGGGEMAGEEDGGGWVATSRGPGAGAGASVDGFEEVASPRGGGSSGVSGSAAGGAGEGPEEEAGGAHVPALDEGDDSDVPDIADLDLEEEEDEAALPAAGAAAAAGAAPISAAEAAGEAAEEEEEDCIVRTRTYDLLITYNKFYQVPQLWLAGYDEARRPLPPSAVLEDVAAEHAAKTVTVEPHPHRAAGVRTASIHPCRHASVMHRLARIVAPGAAEGDSDFQVDHYLVLFLKFIASVVPTIEYDYTMASGAPS